METILDEDLHPHSDSQPTLGQTLPDPVRITGLPGNLRHVWSAARNARWHRRGRCNVCGWRTVFVCLDVETVRGGLFCLRCASFSRKRHVASLLLAELGSSASCLRDLGRLDRDIYSATVGDPIGVELRRFDRYQGSELIAGVGLGEPLPQGGTCQDLCRLTFADESLDVVITEDVLEHVRKPNDALAEIARVLRPGGVHIFTVPLLFDQPTLERVAVHEDGSDEVIVHPAEYHGDLINGRILAYRTWGNDIYERLRKFGFETELQLSTFAQQRLGIVDSYVLVARRV